jgi:hypothetical protein
MSGFRCLRTATKLFPNVRSHIWKHMGENKTGLFSLFVFRNATCGVHNLCLARIERVAAGADIDIELVLGRSDGGCVPADAGHFRSRVVFWMYFCLHNSSGTIRCDTKYSIGFGGISQLVKLVSSEENKLVSEYKKG